MKVWWSRDKRCGTQYALWPGEPTEHPTDLGGTYYTGCGCDEVVWSGRRPPTGFPKLAPGQCVTLDLRPKGDRP